MTAATLTLGEGTPPTPVPGSGTLYFDSGDQQLYVIDAAGTPVGPITGGGGGSPSGPAGGDLGGNYPNPDVTRLQGNAVQFAVPSNLDVLAWNAGASQWQPTNRTVGPSNVVYMAQNGNDSTGARGDASLPFLTLQAAVNNAVTGDTILIGPGVFGVNAVPGTPFVWPAGVSALSVIGCGQDPVNGTTINDAVINTTLLEISGQPITSFRLENLCLSAQFAATVINAVDTGSPATTYMLGAGLILRNIRFGSVLLGGVALNAENVNLYTIEEVDFSPVQDVNLKSCVERVPMRNARARNLVVRFNAASASKPSTWGYGISQKFIGCRFNGAVYLGEQASVDFDKTCTVEQNLTSDLATSGLLAATVTYAPHVRFHGRAANIAFSSVSGTPLPNTNIPMVLDFTEAEVSNDGGTLITMGIVTLGVVGATFRQRVKADGVVAGSVWIEDGIDYFDRFLDIAQISVSTTGGGTIAPRCWSAKPVLAGTGLDVVAFLNPFTSTNVTTYAAPYSAQVSGTTVAQGVLAIAASSVTDVTVASGAAAGSVYVSANWNDTY